MAASLGQNGVRPSVEARRPWLRDGFAALFLVAVTVLVYWPALHGTFLWDDNDHISGNTTLHSLRGLWAIWFKPGATCQYYPLTFTGFWAGYQLWGLNPLGYHLLNALLHGLVAVLLWQVLARLKARGAWLAGALFALHPVCVMSVAWMTELKNTLSAALALCAGWAYLRFAGLGVYEASERNSGDPDGPGAGKRWRFYALSLALFQLALFAKTAVSFLPVSLLLVTWWRSRSERGLRWRDVWPLIPMLGMVGAMGWVTFHIEQLHGASGEQFKMGFLERVLVSGRSFWFYLGKLLVPYQLTFIYPRWQLDARAAWQYLYPLAAAGVLAWLWWDRRRLGKGLFVALLHFYVSTSLLILLVVLYMTRYSFVSDHWQYFGCMSVMALAAAGITAGLARFETGKPFLKPALCGTLLLALGGLTWRQCGMYADLETLWRTTIAANPRCSIAHNNLGNIAMQRGQVDEAAAYFQKALEIQPDFAEAHYNSGNVLLQRDQLDEAIAHFQKAVEIEPDFAEAHNNLGNALLQRGRVDEAIAHFQKAVEIQPEFAEAHNNLGGVLFEKGQLDDAIAHFQEALIIQPDNPKIHNDLGNALLQKGRWEDAMVHYQKALAILPDFELAHCNFGFALLQTGRVDEAIAHFQEALAVKPGFLEAHYHLANALIEKGKVDEAVVHFRRALEIQPDFAGAHINLASALLQEGRVREALEHCREALRIQPDNPDTLSNLAWVLATWPEASVRNGTEAVELAQRANQLSGGRDAMTLRTLAAAYAEGGRFAEAVTTAQRARQLATARINTTLADTLRREIELYQSGSPFRHTGPRDAPAGQASRDQPGGW